MKDYGHSPTIDERKITIYNGYKYLTNMHPPSFLEVSAIYKLYHFTIVHFLLNENLINFRLLYFWKDMEFNMFLRSNETNKPSK